MWSGKIEAESVERDEVVIFWCVCVTAEEGQWDVFMKPSRERSHLSSSRILAGSVSTKRRHSCVSHVHTHTHTHVCSHMQTHRYSFVFVWKSRDTLPRRVGVVATKICPLTLNDAYTHTHTHLEATEWSHTHISGLSGFISCALRERLNFSCLSPPF